MRTITTLFSFTLARRVTIESSNATVEVTSHGDWSLVTESSNKDCGLKGGCKSDLVACSLFESKYCPIWENVVANAGCVLPNAPELCCDSVPAPCVQQWESSGKIGVYCSDSSSCRKPACSQREEYLEDMHSAEMAADKKFAKCFFASGKSQCDNKKSNFGPSQLGVVGSAGALLERAEASAPALEEEVALDTALSEKDDVTVSENNVPTNGIEGNEDLVNFAETGASAAKATPDSVEADADSAAEKVPAEGVVADADGVEDGAATALTEEAGATEGTDCDEKIARRVACNVALKNQLLGDDFLSRIFARGLRKGCDKCLRAGSSTPSCADSLEKIAAQQSLNIYDKTYCKCML